MEERLQKVMAARGVTSRRKCEELILAGRVKVNGQVVDQLGYKVEEESDQIEVDGKVIGKVSFKYILLHKPTGFITSASDPQGRKVVTDLVKNVKERVYPVGRLDYDTSGLLLLTNDGELANRIAHPRFEIDKVYLATVKGIPSAQALHSLRNGIMLEDGMTYPAKAEIEMKDLERNQATIRLTIHEGRNRQVRRMCQAVGHPVIRLKRIQLGFLTLGNLAPGHYRQLEPSEVDKLRKLFN
ncbi:pseudouridine synthase [Ammoniphilus sp. CFH 90114]|uniref:pseudouridine synthase n=1 Tax=Ammoniphilus sp. CFH 90114 TaxID=2493665 RepID=UPI00100FD1D3|nr:pseudouridine synthase [Ammoniphilus sp. CFH 90114]RXT14039.1 rRNA pseudouridine synthase [Ammoniphilus sp. CFH 90114]